MDGYVHVEYNTQEDGGTQQVSQKTHYVADGGYHIIRFIRTADKATLYVDKMAGLSNIHSCKYLKNVFSLHTFQLFYLLLAIVGNFKHVPSKAESLFGISEIVYLK